MTLLIISDSKLPPIQPFLSSVYPSKSSLPDNIHFEIENLNQQDSNHENSSSKSSLLNPFKKFNWPFAPNYFAQLQPYYLNIARPPLTDQESTTYVSIPYHINYLFSRITHVQKNLDNIQIGANVNPLNHDPMKNTASGCLTRIIDIESSLFKNIDFKNPINDFDILHCQDYEFNLNNSKKLIITANINTLNILGLDNKSQYLNSNKIQNSDSIYPFIENDNDNELENKIIEKPMLRIQFHKNVTSLFALFPLIFIGFDNGELLLINAINLTYKSIKINDLNSCITCLEPFYHPNYDYLLCCGLANGEVLILNPTSNEPHSHQLSYSKKVVGQDSKITVFKKFDLSVFSQNQDDELIVGHFKLSHKPITSISSTLPFNNKTKESFQSEHLNPMIIAVSLQDGFVKIIDLMFTYYKNYALNDIQNNSIITDIISNYFNDGVNCIQFSPDFKFLVVAGSGDLIEIFKMSYYNVNGLLKKKDDSLPQPNILNQSLINQSNLRGRRSRSGTINSISSHRGSQRYLPPLIKDIKIVGRFKGHRNSVYHIEFIPGCFYKLISCGFDGKVIIWEFDYRALPKVKVNKPTIQKEQERRRRRSMNRKQHTIFSVHRSPSPISKIASIPTNAGVFLQASRSYHDDGLNNYLSPGNVGGTNMNTIFGAPNVPETNSEISDSQNEIAISIYKSLFDSRVKKHYKNCSSKENLLIHPIIDDKLVPAIEIPLLSLDLGCYIKDGKIDGFHLDDNYFWCFGKSGDIFRYEIMKA